MADDWFDITKIKGAMKKASTGPIAFAFGVGPKLEDGMLAMHRKKAPAFLLKLLKKEGFKASRILVGTARTEGSLLVVTCEAEVPKAKKSIKFFMKENRLVQKQVQLIGPDGEFGVDDDEEEQDTDEAAQKPTATEGPGEDQIEFQSRFAKITPRVKKALAELGADAKPVGVKFKQAHSMGQSGDFGQALTLLDELEELINKPPTGAPQKESTQENPLAAEWSKRLSKLVPQIKEVLTSKLEGSREIALKFKEAQTLERKQDFEAGIAMLDEVSSMIENLLGGQDELKAEWTKRLKTLAPQMKEVLTAKLEGSRDIALKFKEAQVFEGKQDFESGIAMLDEVSSMIKNLSSGQDKQEADWTKRFKTLEPDLASVLEQKLGDPSKLRAARDMAIEKAGSGDHATALKILDRLQPAVAKALSSAKLSDEGEQVAAASGKGKIAPGIAFTQSRLAWNSARTQIQSDLTSLEKAIHDAASDEAPEVFAEIKGKTSALYDILGTRNEKLIDKLDEGLSAEKDSPAQLKAYNEAGKLVKDYASFVNGSPLVQEIDSNPFKPVNVKKTLDKTLQDLAGKLAA